MKHWPRIVGGLVVIVLSVLFWPSRPVPKSAVLPETQPEDTKVAPPPLQPPPPLPLEPEVTKEQRLAELAGPNGVVCPVEPDGIGATARLQAELPDDFLGIATVGAGHVVLSEVPPQGEGTLLVEGFAPAPIAWVEDGEGAHCVPKVVRLEPASTAVTGTVANHDSETTVEVCGRPALIDEEGGFYADASAGEDCSVRVRRHYGTFQWQVEEVVRPRLGRDAVVSFERPEVDAVLPMVLVAAEGGLQVVADWTGQELAGRIVVDAGGVAAGDDPVEFHLAVGGAPADVVVVRFSDGEDAEVELKVLTFDDWLLQQ